MASVEQMLPQCLVFSRGGFIACHMFHFMSWMFVLRYSAHVLHLDPLLELVFEFVFQNASIEVLHTMCSLVLEINLNNCNTLLRKDFGCPISRPRIYILLCLTSLMAVDDLGALAAEICAALETSCTLRWQLCCTNRQDKLKLVPHPQGTNHYAADTKARSPFQERPLVCSANHCREGFGGNLQAQQSAPWHGNV